MGCVESIGSFQLSVCFMKACRASAHAQQTKQNETSEQRELKRDTEYRKSKEVSSGTVFRGSGGELLAPGSS